MKVGIVGLGLIGGSLARAYAKAGWQVYAVDHDEDMLAFAQREWLLWFRPWRVRPQPPALTALWWKFITTPAVPCATAPNP